jgi:hypothetical protein
MLHPGDMKPEHMQGLSLVVGSPTQKFTAPPSITCFLKGPPNGVLDGVKVAAFDARIPPQQIEEIRIQAFFVRFFGYAAEPIAKRREKKGGKQVTPPEGFYVKDTKGPSVDGELDRAAEWAQQIAAKA